MKRRLAGEPGQVLVRAACEVEAVMKEGEALDAHGCSLAVGDVVQVGFGLICAVVTGNAGWGGRILQLRVIDGGELRLNHGLIIVATAADLRRLS